MVQKGQIPERQARPLTKLEPEQQGREKGRGVVEGQGEAQGLP